MSKQSYVPKQPSDFHSILARHKYRVRRKGGNVVPALRWFSPNQWNALPATVDDNGKTLPKQGWVKVDPEKFFVPPEAMDAGDQDAGGDDPEEMSVEEQIEIRDAIMEGSGDDYTVAKLRDFVRDHEDIEIADITKLNKGQLLQEIKSQLINAA